MAQSHDDREWHDSLKRKCAAMQELGLSQITGGSPGEPVLLHWTHGNMDAIRRPDDEHGITRVSIGGESPELDKNYLVFRGEPITCRALLQQAIDAIDARMT